MADKKKKNPVRVRAGKRARDKGIRGEQEAAKMFRRWWPKCCRSFGQNRRGEERPDLEGGPEKYFYIEVKRKNKFYPKELRDMWDKLIKDHIAHQKLTGDDTDRYEIMMFREDGNTEWTVWMHVETMNEFLFGRPYRGLWFTPNDNGERPLNVTETTWPSFAAALDEIYPIQKETV